MATPLHSAGELCVVNQVEFKTQNPLDERISCFNQEVENDHCSCTISTFLGCMSRSKEKKATQRGGEEKYPTRKINAAPLMGLLFKNQSPLLNLLQEQQLLLRDSLATAG